MEVELKIHNVHRRQIDRPIAELEELIAGLASTNDLLWPHERWPAMRLTPGLAAGARGGHGPIRYTCTWQSARKVVFEFDKMSGLAEGIVGQHLIELDESGCLEHRIEAETRGLGALLRWQLIIRPLHDALLEDLLDKAASPRLPLRRLGLWVQLLRRLAPPRRRDHRTAGPLPFSVQGDHRL